MSDRCSSTLVCSAEDREVFENLGYHLEETKALDLDGAEVPGAVLMTDDEASEGHYDELTGMQRIPFVASNTACPGVWGDHLLTSSGEEWAYSESLH